MEMARCEEDNATLPAIVDLRAASEPDRLYGATTWVDGEGTLRYRNLTYSDVANAVDCCAHWLHERFGKSSSFETLAYVGLNDYRYHLITMAVAKLGFTALLLAPWNPMATQLNLMHKRSCSNIIAADDDPNFEQAVKDIQNEPGLKVHRFLTLKYILDTPKGPHYAFGRSLDDVRHKEYVIIHTSGSTGHPKPMVYRYGAMAALKWLVRPKDIRPDYPATNIQDVWCNRRHLMALTPSHMGGVLGLGPFNIYYNMPMILAPGDRPLTSDIIAKIFRLGICDASFIPPVYLQGLSRDAKQVESLQSLKHVTWVGAPFTSSVVPDAIRSRTRIEAGYGSSEAGPTALIIEDQKDYGWVHFHDIMGWEMRYFADDLFELMLKRNPEIEKAQFIFQNFPDMQEWATKDLWSKHPERSDLWRFRGRKDDIVTLGNGRNIEPGLMESAVTGHLKIKSALMFGDGQLATGLLVEALNPPKTSPEITRLRDEIWPIVETTNELINSYGRVNKSMILFTTADKPFKRTGKGSVQRLLTIVDYKAEIEQQYSTNERAGPEQG